MFIRRKNKFIWKNSVEFQDIELFNDAVNKHSDTYQHWILDFQKITSFNDLNIIGLCCQVLDKKESGLIFDYIPSTTLQIAKTFTNNSYSYCLGNSEEESKYKGTAMVPVKRYRNGDEHIVVVDSVIRCILSNTENLKRSDFSALEWAINEITDNVLVHSESTIGGLIFVKNIDRKNNKVHFIVADCGRGITETLGTSLGDTSSVSVLDKAIKEGITRDKNVGQGNGLYGSHAISHQGKGFFEIISNNATLQDKKGKLFISTNNFNYQGTIIELIIDFSEENLISKALVMGGQQYTPVDIIETHFEEDQEDLVTFRIREESGSFGTRFAGKPLRDRIININRMYEFGNMVIDFNELPVISSSFADEVVGKLLLDCGEEQFNRQYRLICSEGVNKQIINRTISQRLNDLSQRAAIAA